MPSVAIVAWYGVCLIGGQYELIGPYDDRDECASTIAWLDRKGFETETCTMVNTDVESILIRIKETGSCCN